MLFAHISDTHIKPEGRLAYRRVDTAAFLSRAVDRLNRLDPQPDFVLVTGDLVDAGGRDEYERLRALLEPLEADYYLIAGNHDGRDALRDVFSDHLYWPEGPYLHYTIETQPVRLIAFDSTEPGYNGGTCDEARVAWLDARLGESSRPTVIFMHHPPLDVGLVGMDSDPFKNREKLAAVIARHPHVERIVCGHMHRPIHARWNGTIVATVPSTAHQVTLDLRADQPATFVMEPPAYYLHEWIESEALLVTHMGYVETYDGPYPFREGGELIP